MSDALDPRPEGPPPDLGARIRAAREEAGLSVRGLARQIGVSASLLSQVERGLAQPSVATLWALVTELGLSLDSLFAGPGENGPGADGPAAIVQRARGRPSIALGGGVVWERLTATPDRDADFAFVTYPPGADSGADDPPATHSGREYGYVIGGRLRIEVGDEIVELGPGDAVAFGSETPHRFRALGDEPVTAVWLNLRARV
jgi:transcriptional regulator with XRE-family HTH domain